MKKINSYSKLKVKIERKDAIVAVIGLGYVGLPYAIAFADAGFTVHGIDLNKDKIQSIQSGVSYILDVDSKKLKELVQKGKLFVRSDYNSIAKADAVVVCVPTPLNKTRDPELSYIISAFHNIKERMRHAQLLVLSSTTYPGTTTELVLPVLKENNLVVGRDVFLAFSPERIDPGNAKYALSDIPKVVGGITPKCAELSSALFKHIVKEVIIVRNTTTAEMVKLLENTFRSINIAFVNELAMMCSRLGVNIWEVIRAASTKPYGFMPFYPGPGMGGHCIPVDPLYLSWKMKILNYRARFIELAEEINRDMPYFVVQRIAEETNKMSKPLFGSRIGILGVTYKKDVNDIRESPAIEIIKILREKGAMVSYNDPMIPNLSEDGVKMSSKKLTKQFLKNQVCVVILSDHSFYDWDWIVRHSNLVIDFRNATANVQNYRQNIVLL